LEIANVIGEVSGQKPQTIVKGVLEELRAMIDEGRTKPFNLETLPL
jgi:hypothetical protein